MASKYKRTLVDFGFSGDIKKLREGLNRAQRGLIKARRNLPLNRHPLLQNSGPKMRLCEFSWLKITRQANVLFYLKGLSVHHWGIRLCIVWLYRFLKRESVTIHGNSRQHKFIHDSQHRNWTNDMWCDLSDNPGFSLTRLEASLTRQNRPGRTDFLSGASPGRVPICPVRTCEMRIQWHRVQFQVKLMLRWYAYRCFLTGSDRQLKAQL